MRYEIGRCYEVTLENGETVVFRAMGGEPVMGEVPPGSGNLVCLDTLFRVYQQISEVQYPAPISG